MKRLLLFLLCVTFVAVAADNNPRVVKLRGLKGLWLAPPPPYSPSDIPNLFGWWKADTLTNLIDGSGVAFWTDSSGHNLHMTPGDANAPYWTNNFQGGKPAVFFDGVNDYMTNACAMTQTNALFFVIRHMIPAAATAYFFETASTDPPNGEAFGAAQAFRWDGGIFTNAIAYAGAGMTATNCLTNTITTYVVNFATHADQTLSGIWTNGVQAGSDFTCGQLTMNGMKVGSSAAVNNFFKGHLLEMFCITNTSATEGTIIQDTTLYFRNKYAHY